LAHALARIGDSDTADVVLCASGLVSDVLALAATALPWWLGEQQCIQWPTARSSAKKAEDAMETPNNEKARRALLTVRRYLQDAVVTLMFADACAPDLRADLQAESERLVQVAEVIQQHAVRMLLHASPLPEIPKANS
jgi:hypothetical protein